MVDGVSERSLIAKDLFHFLATCPGVIGMTVIRGPEVFRTGTGGICGLTVIAESHISIHANGTEVHVDVFSCRGFAVERAIQFIAEDLGLQKYRMQHIERSSEL